MTEEDEVVFYPVDDDFLRIFNLDKSIRGPYLIQAIAIEGLISSILSEHLCPDDKKRSLLYSLILNKLNFAAKIRALEELVSIEFPEVVPKYKELFKGLVTIRELRNTFAHSYVDTSDVRIAETTSKSIYLEYYKRGTRHYEEFSVKRINKELAYCSKIIVKLIGLQKYVLSHNKRG